MNVDVVSVQPEPVAGTLLNTKGDDIGQAAFFDMNSYSPPYDETEILYQVCRV